MAHGHSWSDIKHYTLSEIGVFLRVCLKRNKLKTSDDIINQWLSNNLTKKGLTNIINKIDSCSEKKEPIVRSKEETAKDWRKLAAAMRGRR